VEPSGFQEADQAVVSALAEGAGWLVAKEVLADKDARLEVALPLPKQEYVKDFKSEASKEEFCCLLARASETAWQAPDGLDRDEAYERAGRYVATSSGGRCRRVQR
jgi:hypothetical protein